MKKLKIETISNGSIHLIVDENGETAARCMADETSQEKAKLYAGQLTLAYNNTYGEGINPRCVVKLMEACKEFVRKVECGEARSKKSYAQMKDALENALLE